MKGVVSKCVGISQRRQRDGWFRGVTEPNSCLDASKALCSMVQRANLHQGWDLVGGGVTDLAFTLLDVRPSLGGKPDARIKELWSVGRQVLIATFKSCSASIKTVLPMLAKRIKSSQAAPQFTDCLKSVVRQALSLCMENAALLGDLVARLQTLGLPGAKRTISALLPLIKVCNYQFWWLLFQLIIFCDF